MKKTSRISILTFIFILSLFFIMRLLFANYCYKIGKIAMDNKNFDKALIFLERSSNLNPFTYEPYMKAGKIMNLKGNYANAITANMNALRNYPYNQYIYNNLGISYKGTHDVQNAIICFQKAISLDPEFKEAMMNLAGFYMENGYFEESLNMYNKLLELGESSYLTLKNLGDIYSIKGNFTKAMEYYSSAYKMNPEDPSLLSNYGRILYLQNKWDQAKKMLLKALDKDPNLIQPRLLLSEIYEKEKSFLKAVEQYKILMMMNNSKLNYNIKIKEMESKLESEKKNLLK